MRWFYDAWAHRWRADVFYCVHRRVFNGKTLFELVHQISDGRRVFFERADFVSLEDAQDCALRHFCDGHTGEVGAL